MKDSKISDCSSFVVIWAQQDKSHTAMRNELKKYISQASVQDAHSMEDAKVTFEEKATEIVMKKMSACRGELRSSPHIMFLFRLREMRDNRV